MKLCLKIGFAVSVCGVATVAAPRDSSACGGCFHPEQQPQQTSTTVVTAHRMALSISQTQTVLWDQVQYDGSPEEFAWVLPVKPGARIEVGSDAWFEVLDAATSTRVIAPAVDCSFGLGPAYGFSRG